MYDLPQNTIYGLLENPVHTAHRFSGVKASELINEVAKFKSNHKIAVPESEAILFYLVNHAMHTIRQSRGDMEELPADLSKFAMQCNEICTRISKALFFHVCCVAHGMLWVHKLEKNQMDFFEASFGKGFAEYLTNKPQRDSLSLISGYDMSIHQFLGGISSVYSFGKIIAWGKPYSMIVKTLHRCSNGS